jgi:hypothetical protein
VAQAADPIKIASAWRLERRALRQRQAGLAGAADLERRREQEGRPARPAVELVYYDDQNKPGHRARDYTKLLDVDKVDLSSRLRHQPDRSAHAHRDGAQAHDHGIFGLVEQRKVQVPELLPDLAERPEPETSTALRFFELAPGRIRSRRRWRSWAPTPSTRRTRSLAREI